jgi:succinoglycan biosynthesis protein ExoA
MRSWTHIGPGRFTPSLYGHFSGVNSVGAPGPVWPLPVASLAVDGTRQDSWPSVSVVMPVLNEQLHLAEAVERVLTQDYPGALEIILALGPSSDATDEIAAALCAADARVRTVPNPTGRTPAGLNAAIAAAGPTSEFIIRVDGHAMFPTNYISTAVKTLQETGADNVGGVMAAEGSTAFEMAVACAMRSPLGVGAAAFHVGGKSGPALTVYLGAFRRSALERVGGYDERFVRSQDWELNHRIRETGGQVWFTPELEVAYRPRSTIRRLAHQYFEYGRWRRVVMRRHSGTVSFRYLAPPLLVCALVLGVFLGLWGVEVGWLVPLGYALAVIVGGMWIGRGQRVSVRCRIPLVLATMHCAWGSGFLTSRIRLDEV